MKRVYDRVSGVQDVPSYYRPRRWRVRSRLKFLITRPRLREWADRYGLIVGVVNVRVGEMTEEHAREISQALFIGDREIEGVHAASPRSGHPRVQRDGERHAAFSQAVRLAI
jgi:hypothetical protein